MATGDYAEPLQRTSRRNPCPICGHDHWCSYTSEFVLCMRVESKTPAKGGKGWLHFLDEGRGKLMTPVPIRSREGVAALPVLERDRWYRTLVSQLSLATLHQMNLEQRGLSQRTISRRGYRTMPATDRFKVCDQVLMHRAGEPLGVPGFYQHPKTGNWTLAGPTGLLIPVTNESGLVEGFQIRVDNADDAEWTVETPLQVVSLEGGVPARVFFGVVSDDGERRSALVFGSLAIRASQLKIGDTFRGSFRLLADGRFQLMSMGKARRYAWVSSDGKPSGSSPGAPLHWAFPQGRPEHPDVVWVTEGPLKADVLAELRNDVAIALPGVTNVGNLVERLVARQTKWAIIAHDMDADTNIHVAIATARLAADLKAAGIKTVRAQWNPDYKGIDDALVAGQEVKLTSFRFPDAVGSERLNHHVGATPKEAMVHA